MTKPKPLEPPPALLMRSSSGKLPYATQESLHWVAANMWRYRPLRRSKTANTPTDKDD